MTARYETLAKWANEFGWRLGAELGVSDGRTFLYLLEHCPKLHLFGIDTWDVRSVVPSPTASNEVCHCEYCEETRAAKQGVPVSKREEMARQGAKRFAGRAFLRKMDTIAAAKTIAKESLDFVFIDAGHDQESVSADIAAWKDKVKTGGRLCGHDWNMKSVRDAIGKSGLLPGSAVTIEDDHLWWFEA